MKTALGAEDTVPWEHSENSLEAASKLRGRGYELAVIETSVHSVDLFDWTPRFPVCVIFGNELDGVAPDLVAMCDTYVRIPMLGLKHSLNVATSGGIVMYELLRKYRHFFSYQVRIGFIRCTAMGSRPAGRSTRLDVLRAIAALLVVCMHVKFVPILSAIGWIGVDLFFVLSGFLISRLLFTEAARAGAIQVGQVLSSASV